MTKLAKSINKHLLLYLLLFFFIFRIINLTKLPIFNDEAIYLYWGWLETHEPSKLYFSLADAKQPFLMWIFGLSQSIINQPLLAGRLISVITGLFSALGLYLLAQNLFNRRTAIFSFITYTLVPLFHFYDRQALMESSLAAIYIWLFYALIKIKSNKPLYLCLLGLLLGLGFFIKTTALIFYLSLICLTIFFYFQKPPPHRHFLSHIFLGLIISQIILFPLYFQPQFSTTFASNSRYSLTLSQLMAFPLNHWLKNILDTTQILFYFLTPTILITSLFGIYDLIKKKRLLYTSILLWFLLSLIIIILTAQNITSRYLVPFLPLCCLFSAYFLAKLKSKLFPFFISGILIIPLTLSLTLTFSPLTYFNVLDYFTKLSDKSSYVTNWTAGYGIPETINYLTHQSLTQPIIVGVRLDAGNPESAIHAYFARSQNIHTTFFDAQLFDPQLLNQFDCFSSQIPFYFVSRDNHLANLNKYFQETTRFYKPQSQNYIGIHTLKPNCQGKTLILQ